VGDKEVVVIDLETEDGEKDDSNGVNNSNNEGRQNGSNDIKLQDESGVIGGSKTPSMNESALNSNGKRIASSLPPEPSGKTGRATVYIRFLCK
jgi:hypothetical protein